MPMTGAAPSGSRPSPVPAGPGTPRESVRIVTASPSAWWASSVPAAPISTSPGCAPIASTLSVVPAGAAGRWAIREATLAARSSGIMGFWMNSVPASRSVVTARATDGCAVTTATGSDGSRRRTRSRNSRPVRRGISTSVITRSQRSDSTSRSPSSGSSRCLISNPRACSTLVAHTPKTRSSSMSRIRPRGASGLGSSIVPSGGRAAVPRGRVRSTQHAAPAVYRQLLRVTLPHIGGDSPGCFARSRRPARVRRLAGAPAGPDRHR